MIIVHDGQAHTDDFLAVCVLLHKLNCRAIRTKAKQEHLDDYKIILNKACSEI